ncbi:MAG: MFS transporter [Elusimicrobia bacterium]|nr:MFS transporter [Elusimicrobiota bacterium]
MTETVEQKPNIALQLVSVMIAFFVMSFVDSVGIATNYVKADLNLSDSLANLLPSMVFLWFLVCSVPTGMLMNKIGRRKTVLISLVLTLVALIVPLAGKSFAVMMVSFVFLGVGNAVLQVSLNPLVSNIVSGERLASALTFGQFVKAVGSFSAPIVAAFAAVHFHNWKYMYLGFMIFPIISIIAIAMNKIKEEEMTGRVATFKECFSLLGDGVILLCFIGIICHVGVDVGINVSAPKVLMERLGWTLEKAGYATSLYFLFRTVGAFLGTFILARWSAKKFFILSVLMLLVGVLGLIFMKGMWPLYVSIALLGFGNANIFSLIFSQALLHKPNQKNETSGLMIMGVFGGALFPPIMGVMSDAFNAQSGAMMVVGVGVLYLLFLALRTKEAAAA